MFRQIMGIIVVFITLVLAATLMPVVNELIDPIRDSSNGNFNCASYSGTNPYNDSLDSNTLGCAVVPLVVPLTILFILLGGIGMILYGRSEQTPAYQ